MKTWPRGCPHSNQYDGDEESSWPASMVGKPLAELREFHDAFPFEHVAHVPLTLKLFRNLFLHLLGLTNSRMFGLRALESVMLGVEAGVLCPAGTTRLPRAWPTEHSQSSSATVNAGLQRQAVR